MQKIKQTVDHTKTERQTDRQTDNDSDGQIDWQTFRLSVSKDMTGTDTQAFFSDHCGINNCLHLSSLLCSGYFYEWTVFTEVSVISCQRSGFLLPSSDASVTTHVVQFVCRFHSRRKEQW